MNHTSSLGQAEALKAIQVIEAELTKRGKAAVKAYTAARKNEPTRDIGQRLRNPDTGFDIAYFGDPRFVGWGGGLPVRVNDQVVGAVAVSGLPETQDMETVALGVKAIIG